MTGGPFGRVASAFLLGIALLAAHACKGAGSDERVIVAPDSGNRLITVAPDVRLELLDWGGTGPAMLFLAGMGGDADNYRAFAARFRDGYKLYGLNRRGAAGSSTPASGYDAATRAHDIIVVLDSLHLAQAILVGHSFAGDELSKVGATYPARVRALVYLDAYDYPGPPSGSLPPLPPQAIRQHEPKTPEQERLIADLEAHDTQRAINASTAHITARAPDELAMQGAEHADYSRITVPALAIYSDHATSAADLFGNEYDRFDTRNKAMARRYARAYEGVFRNVQERFKTRVRRGQVVIIPGADHFIFRSNPDEVERAMREFLRGIR